MPTTYSPFGRMFVAPVLPYHPGAERIDEAAYRALLARFLAPQHIDSGIALVANPEASEIFYLSEDEKRRVLDITLEEAAGRVPVLAGVSHATTVITARAAAQAVEAGADGLFVMPPIGMGDISVAWDAERYPEVFVDLIRAIADAADLPIVVHPTATPSPQYGVGLPAGATQRIIDEIPNVVGWKMTYNYDGYRRITRVLREADRPVDLLGAVAKYFHENLAADEFDGTVTGALNYALEPMLAHIAAWRRGDLDEARRIWNSGLAALQEYIYSDFSRLHIRYKAATWLRGWIPTPEMRAPVPRPRREEVETLRVLLEALGLPLIDKDADERFAQ
jgi:dihydrodipicolinate synthase/N-acetylneuraminate lyase